MLEKMVIREAGFNDISQIQTIAQITWQDTYRLLIPINVQQKFLSMAYSTQRLKERINGSRFLVAQEDSQIIGFANSFVQEKHAELAAIYVLPDKQRKGAGSALLEETLQKLNGISRITVDVEKGNTIAESFYKRHGFRLIDEYEDDFSGFKFRTTKLERLLPG